MARPHRVSLPGACATAVAVAALTLAGCASGSRSGTPGGPSGSPVTTPSASGPATPATAAPTPTGTTGDQGTLSLTFSDNGTSVHLKVGERLHIALATPFWTFRQPDTPSVLRQDATGIATPTVTCSGPAGTGCGTRTADYTAISTGSTTVTATRVVCGEAMRCTGSSARFVVDAVVD